MPLIIEFGDIDSDRMQMNVRGAKDTRTGILYCPKYCWKDYRDGRQKMMELKCGAFIRRFLQHGLY
ncbi:MAG: hypothetical protein WD431_23105 [Cyclobacteriaceae bacterium]